VDPGDRWVKRLSSPGPQVITGMRGCGKTLLLRALELHARASNQSGEGTEAIVRRLRDDGFVGLYVSSTKLLDVPGSEDEELFRPYERLFVAYALEALRAA